MKPLNSMPLAQRLIAAVVDRLSRRIAWYTTGVRDLAGGAADRFSLVLVLGREHYSESRRSYPALGTRDLVKVVRGELVGEPEPLFLPGPNRDDRRDVTFYRLHDSITAGRAALARSLFVIPESVLLATQLNAGAWAEVEREGYRYFLFSDAPSQPAGGALGDRKLVALAAGMDPEEAPLEWRGDRQLVARLRKGLGSLPAATWWACRNPRPFGAAFSRIAWRPIATTLFIALFAYLAVSTLYLQTTLGLRERALDIRAPEVQEGLAADTEARQLAARRDALLTLWTDRPETQRLWAAVASAVENGAGISSIEMRGREISISGEAPDASVVLAALAGMPGFEAVEFQAPVRVVRGGRQNFALALRLAASRAGGEIVSE